MQRLFFYAKLGEMSEISYNYPYAVVICLWAHYGLTNNRRKNAMNEDKATGNETLSGTNLPPEPTDKQNITTPASSINTSPAPPAKKHITIISAVIAVVILLGVTVGFYIFASSDSDTDGDSIGGLTQEEINRIKYAATHLREHAENLDRAIAKLDEHILDSGGWADLDFNVDTEMQEAMQDLIAAADSLGRAIMQGIDEPLKAFWQEFASAFDLRRDFITSGLHQAYDLAWYMLIRELAASALHSADHSEGLIGHEERDVARMADVATAVSQLNRFALENSGFLPFVNFSTRTGQPTSENDAPFLDGFLGRARGEFRDPHGINYGFIRDSRGHAATTDTMVYSGVGFLCGTNGRFVETDEHVAAISIKLESGEFYCRDSRAH